MVLVFIGTLAQVDLGLYKAQEEIFRSFVIFWGPKGADWKIPVFPGGYLIGGILLINLVAAHYRRFGFRRDKAGIIITHFGIILLLVGQIGTDLLSRESSLHLRLGEAKPYSESDRRLELAIIDVTDPQTDSVIAIPDSRLATEREIRDAALPFQITVRQFLPNSSLSATAKPGYEKVPATAGVGPQLWYRAEPKVTKMDARDVPTGIVEFRTPQGQSLGTWLISGYLNEPQTVKVGGRTYQVDLRMRRYYHGFNLRLMEFHHDVYKGTDIPKNFSSLVRVQNPRTGEDRQVKIYMNNPLRYGGLTFYQASYDPDNQGSILQVVRNPSWLTPYLACILVGGGLLIQFLSHLIPFLKRRLKS
jgi:hypothetical protein